MELRAGDLPLELLWVGFQTLCGREIGCLERKDVTLTSVKSFEAARRRLTRRASDIVVLSMTADAGELAAQIELVRSLAPSAMVVAVVCNRESIAAARAAGADDVTALEDEGDLVCAPVLRWVDTRRGAGSLVDLRGATRRRHALLDEVDRLNRRVQALERQVVRDPGSGLLGRDAFTGQLQLAAELAAATGQPLAVVVVDIEGLQRSSELFGDFIVGGVVNRISAILREIGRRCDVVGRLEPGRFAIALPGCDRAGMQLIAGAIGDRVGAVELPGQSLTSDVCAGQLLRSEDPSRAARQLLERVEAGLGANATQIMSR